MSSPFRTTIASPPDREKHVEEIFFGSEQVAEINQESGDLRIEIYPRPNGEPWVLPCEEFLAILNDARRRLVANDA